MILMVIIKVQKSISIWKNLEFFENTDNSPKYEILSSILFLVFTGSVLLGRDYPCTKAGVMFDRLKKKLHSNVLQAKFRTSKTLFW